VCTRSGQNATARVEPMSLDTFYSRMVKIARLIGTTERCPFRFRNAPAFRLGRFLVTMLVPKRIAQEARRFSSSVFC
jgi:hypothetical protein